MAIRVEVNPDGSLHYISDGHLVLTGPITGTVELPDGRSVNVSPAVVEVADEAEALALSNAIGKHHEKHGHPDFVADPNVDSFGFVHIPADLPKKG